MSQMPHHFLLLRLLERKLIVVMKLNLFTSYLFVLIKKRDGCPPFEKQPIEKKVVQDGAKKRRPRWRLGNKELSQLWKWSDQNPNALTDPQRVQTPSIAEYWKPLAEDMDPAAGIEAEYHHKNNRVYCWKGLRFSARQDLEGFSKVRLLLKIDHRDIIIVRFISHKPEKIK
ncbi:THO complex subunit 1-like [Cannabis sativa]|uniref:THO complex subunit 1-like n=1 Tax=Cannabis sativa TaxID=3483 RepID=UPI0029CA76C6|nr:THO complex subunit 1-like [Cannabis sativa]